MTDLNASRISLTIHTLAGFGAGYLYFYIENSIFLFLAAIAILFVTGFITEKIVKKDMVKKAGIKWWLGNGALIFILIWLVAWIYFFNTV